MDEPESFADRLRIARLRARKNQADVAAACGVDQSTVSKWENGTEPSYANIAPICRLLDVSADYLLGLSPVSRSAKPGRWLIDLDLYQNPDRKRALGTQVPMRAKIVDEDEARRMEADYLRRRDG